VEDDDEAQAHASAVDCLSVTVQVDYLPVRAARADIVELPALRYRQCLSWLHTVESSACHGSWQSHEAQVVNKDIDAPVDDEAQAHAAPLDTVWSVNSE